MIVIGYEGIKHPEFKKISSIEQIAMVDNASIVWFESSDDEDYGLCNHCHQYNIKYAIKVENLTDFILRSCLNPTYVILEKSPDAYQKITETYLLDTKILYVIEDKNEIVELAKMGIDGVIFRHILE